MHKDDELCLKEFKKGISYDKINKRYTVALPFNKKKLMLPTNRSTAFSRMRQLQIKFIKDPEYGRLYKEQIDCLEEKEFIEQVTQKTETGEIIHYLPHRGIEKKESLTTSLRIVMDGSSKQNASTCSLNDVLYTGPKIGTDLVKCIIRMRCGRFAATSDLEKAFLKLLIRTKDRDALRFFSLKIFMI